MENAAGRVELKEGKISYKAIQILKDGKAK
jgi:hypothetical protein